VGPAFARRRGFGLAILRRVLALALAIEGVARAVAPDWG
jgi:hypothetical protein